MAGAASLGALPPAGWACGELGGIENGEPQCEVDNACLNNAPFVHSQSLEEEDVWRTKVVAGRGAIVGIAGEGYDVERHGETYKSTARVALSSGTTAINPDISKDGEQHHHSGLLKDYIPKTLPYDLALRINKVGNCHSFGSTRTGSGTTLHRKAGLG